MGAIVLAMLILLIVLVIFNVYLTREITRMNGVISNLYIRLNSLEQTIVSKEL